jgi:hypothetical protein
VAGRPEARTDSMESFGLQGAGLLTDIPGVYFDVVLLAAGLPQAWLI